MSSRSSATRAALRHWASLPPPIPAGWRSSTATRSTLDPAALAAAPRKIVANLPYNIATALLLGWLDRIGAFDSLTLMFQREVAVRLVAAPRSKAYGRLSVMTQWLAEPRILFDVPARAFIPPPKVTSAVVAVTPRPAPLAPGLEADARTRHRRRLWPAPQDAALKPRNAGRAGRTVARGSRRAADRPRRRAHGRAILRSCPRPRQSIAGRPDARVP